ncbi:hypothetical protein E2A64_15610 [Pseudohoeflea suaedae]|uniref:Uncharacterized protein n=1 Tax=Pseudohoeflea suaedae TaxID=877384 RepID=A0A4R5PIS7_9HYPH|nr:hypothetical protein [Pseudohoeflea suaedae]TDH35135.1 hypothetical protein E2A64_15610 [Pseudohoeflea suaedae]
MADFVAVIRKAVDNLSDNTPENRERVYSKARAAIRRQLEAMNPPPAEDIMNRQMSKLEGAISEVESEYVAAIEEDQDETDRLMSELEALVDERSTPAAPIAVTPTYVAEPEPPVAEPVAEPEPPVAEEPEPEPEVVEPEPKPEYFPEDPEVYEEAQPVEPPASFGPADHQWTPDADEVQAAPGTPGEDWGPEAPVEETHLEPPMGEIRDEPDVAPEPEFAASTYAPPPAVERPEIVTGVAHDEIFGLGGRGDERYEASAGKPASAPVVEKRRTQVPAGKRGGMAKIALGVAALLLLAVVGYTVWAQKDALMAMFSSDGDVETAAPADTSPATTDEAASDTSPAGEAETNGAPATETPALSPGQQAADDPDRKFTERLNPDGTESNPGPAPELAQASAPVEGRSVAEQTDAGDQAPMQAPATGEVSGVEQAGGQTAAESNEALGVQQKMFLYEERLDQQSPAVSEGSVVWSLIDDPENGGPNNVAIRGEISTDDGNLSALVTIKRNADKSLPASHIIEIVFALPESFTGGGIEQVQRISMKQTEQDQGNPLIAVPAKITEDFYMIALNDLTEAVQTNTQLLRTRSWIDIPVIYTNGRRALITLEKGTSGTEVFNQALDVWAAG